MKYEFRKGAVIDNVLSRPLYDIEESNAWELRSESSSTLINMAPDKRARAEYFGFVREAEECNGHNICIAARLCGKYMQRRRLRIG
jgi:hypothetical protein